jgi:glucose uptake protein GlcU|uniref:Transmembrane protein 144 n=1 Tax=Panagrolaimus sp. PS1159 TaxID=55785 RepID=A0AC35GKS5_9BILA
MQDAIIGCFEVVITLICFGSAFVPQKKFDGGDGMFVQWAMCAGVFSVGFVVNAINGFGPFYPVACIGGFCWAIGNVVQVPTMRRLGMAVSILVWNAVNCVMGWAAGFFGLFGLDAKPASIPWMNILGVLLILVGAVLFALVRRTDAKTTLPADPTGETKSIYTINSDAPLADHANGISSPNSTSASSIESGYAIANTHLPAAAIPPKPFLAEHKDRLIGLGMALLAGVFFGFNVIPVMYIQDHAKDFNNAPSDQVAYIFSHFCGIFLTSSAVFILYALFKRNKPQINPEIALPSFVSGILWGTAQAFFFAASNVLSSAVTYPIVSMVPGVVASLWSVLYFREISGKRDLLILSGAILVTLSGTVMVGISK